MDTTVMLVIVLVIMVAGFVATMLVGKSKSNQQEASGYMHKTGAKLARLSWLYVITIVLAVVIFIAFVK
jgi:hypothetical protein